VVDDEDRENEGDLTMAAEMITPEAINFMATHGRGLICLAMTGEKLDELGHPDRHRYRMLPRGSGAAGTYLPAARPRRRRPGAVRSDGSMGLTRWRRTTPR
jgi:hypothetical protein